MLTLNDGRTELWQWDTGRKLTVDADCTQVHFSNKFFGRSVDVDVFDGTAEIPDVLLQVDKDLFVWAFVGTAENGYTKISKVFKVNKRNKPADYVFTPTEQTTLDEIMKRLSQIEESQDPDAIKNAVDEYLANNPIQVEEKDPNVPDWAKQPTKPKYTVQEVGAVATVNGIAPDENGNVQIPVSGGNVDQEQITIAINTALAQAKASGEFDGKDGKDYVLTEADKQEIAQEAAELVEVPDVDIPTTLPNPNALTFTGAATGTYDGSAPLTVNIPAGGGGTGGGSSGTWELIGEVTSDGAGNSSGIYVPIDFTQYKEVFIEAWIAAGAINRVLMSSNTAWYSGQVLNTNSTTANEYGSINNPRNENVLAQTIIHNICGELKPFSSWCTGYANGGKSVLQVSHARDTYLATSYSYIRMDTHNNGAVAEGNWLKVWGCK